MRDAEVLPESLTFFSENSNTPMESPEPIEGAMKRFEQLVNGLEELI